MHTLEIHLTVVMLKCFAASGNVGLMFLAKAKKVLLYCMCLTNWMALYVCSQKQKSADQDSKRQMCLLQCLL